VEDFAKALTYYLESAEGKSKKEFIKTFAYSVLVEKSGINPSVNSSLLSTTTILNDICDTQHPNTDSNEPIGNKPKVFELRKRLDSVATDIFVGRAPVNDIVLADPPISRSHFRLISIPGTNYHRLADMFSTNGTYLNGKKIDPFEKHQVDDHDEISFGTEYQLIYYSPGAFYEMLIGLKDNESKDENQKQTADDLATLQDSIAKETTDLTEVVVEEESLLDDMALNGENELPWLDSGVFEGDDFVPGLEEPDDSARVSTAIETKGHDLATKLDNQGGEEKMLTEKDEVSIKDDAAMNDVRKDGAAHGSDKKLTVPATTPELEVSRPLDDAMEEVIQEAGEVPSIDDLLFDNPSGDSELVNEVEEKGGEGEKPDLDDLAKKLDTLLNKRIEAIATRLVKEQMSSIVEPIILETIKKLLISMK
jgi:pSer/pThr/pTyr-binding forkhead associated (FHA) protein